MSILSKVITTVFGKKSDKDLKKLAPYIDQINNHYNALSDLSDSDLKGKFINIKNEFKQLEDDFKNNYKKNKFEDEYLKELNSLSQNFLDDKMVEVFAIVKDASRRLLNTTFSPPPAPTHITTSSLSKA